MESYFKQKEASCYEIPNNVVGVLTEPITGALATDETQNKEMFFYLKGTEPSAESNYKDLEAVFQEENNSNT